MDPATFLCPMEKVLEHNREYDLFNFELSNKQKDNMNSKRSFTLFGIRIPIYGIV